MKTKNSTHTQLKNTSKFHTWLPTRALIAIPSSWHPARLAICHVRWGYTGVRRGREQGRFPAPSDSATCLALSATRCDWQVPTENIPRRPSLLIISAVSKLILHFPLPSERKKVPWYRNKILALLFILVQCVPLSVILYSLRVCSFFLFFFVVPAFVQKSFPVFCVLELC